MIKTKMCDFFREGRCKYGSECAFAHSQDDLADMPDLRKTRICRAFTQGKCNDQDCKFAHGQEELRPVDKCFQKALCRREKVKPSPDDPVDPASGDQCRFAHGPGELKAPPGGDRAEGDTEEKEGSGGEDSPAAKAGAKAGAKKR